MLRLLPEGSGVRLERAVVPPERNRAAGRVADRQTNGSPAEWRYVMAKNKPANQTDATRSTGQMPPVGGGERTDLWDYAAGWTCSLRLRLLAQPITANPIVIIA